jgi:hypothetical protein
MAKKSRKREEFDSPWKDALQRYLQSFLAFFFADIHDDVDWSRGYQALDKEFQQIVPEAEVGKLLADKLFKIWLRDGSEQWLLIHIEIQGDYEKEFARRMFDYNAAIWKLYNRDVISLAVLCDDRPDWRPTTFSYGRWGCSMTLVFRSAKLLDHAGQLALLETSNNLFAPVVLAHITALQTRDDPEDRRRQKLRVVKTLYQRDWTKDDVRELFRLIDWIMGLPLELQAAFATELFEHEQEQQMPYLSSIERNALAKGEAQGREKGLIEGIDLFLTAKFGRTGRKLLPKVRALGDLKALRRFGRFLKTASTLDEVRAYFD